MTRDPELAKKNLPDGFRAGQIWRVSDKYGEKWPSDRGRFIKILDPEYEDIGPSWTYCDARGKPEPHDCERHRTWFEHYCDAWDFYVWGRFEFVRGGE